MILDHRNHLTWLRTSLATLTLPVEYTIAWPTAAARTTNSHLVTRKNLLKENEALKAQHLVLQTELQRLNLLEEENAQLRALLHAAPQTHSNKILAAQQLAASPDPFIHEITLDAGKNQNIFTGQAILDAQGVMGQVTQVNPLTSRALLITDTRSAIPVQNRRTGQRAVVTGSGTSNLLYLKHVPETADMKVGDAIVTSGLGGYFPLGYPVGIIHSISKKKGEDFAVISVTPSAQLAHHQVLLVWPDVKTDLKLADPTKASTPSKLVLAGAQHKI